MDLCISCQHKTDKMPGRPAPQGVRDEYGRYHGVQPTNNESDHTDDNSDGKRGKFSLILKEINHTRCQISLVLCYIISKSCHDRFFISIPTVLRYSPCVLCCKFRLFCVWITTKIAHNFQLRNFASKISHFLLRFSPLSLLLFDSISKTILSHLPVALTKTSTKPLNNAYSTGIIEVLVPPHLRPPRLPRPDENHPKKTGRHKIVLLLLP